jgi:hypothetical protein
MSKILRRPMFRGGRVESRGTGITSGLGYAAGGSVNTPKRGLVDGPGGYAGVSMSSIPKNIYNRIFGSSPSVTGATGPASINTATTTGGQLLESTRPMQGPNISPFEQAMENRLKPKLVTGRTIGQRLLDMGGRFVGGNPTLSMLGATAAAFAPVAGLAAANAPETIEELQIMKQYGPVDETWTEDMIQQYEADRAEARKTGTPLGTGETGLTSSSEELQKILDSQIKKPASDSVSTELKSKELLEGPQPTALTREEEIAKNKELFRKELGYDEARRSDIGDLLGRISVAALKRPGRGEKRDLGDIAGDVMQMELAAGPGKREKINQAAATLAINDYVAGKRSREQTQEILAKIRFDTDYKIEATDKNISVKGKDFTKALAMEAKRQDAKLNDDKVIKSVIYQQTDGKESPISINVYQNENYNPNTNIDPNKLQKGLNIIKFKNKKIMMRKNQDGSLEFAQEYPLYS